MAAPAMLRSCRKVERVVPAVLGSCQKVEKLLRQCIGTAQSSKLHFPRGVRNRAACESTITMNFEPASRSKSIRNHVRRNCSKMLGSAPLHSVSLKSVPPFSVNGYARFTLVYILYIYIHIHLSLSIHLYIIYIYYIYVYEVLL